MTTPKTKLTLARRCVTMTYVFGILFASVALNAAEFQSHAPMRPLPQTSQRPLAAGPAYFADPARGDDANPGTIEKPWRTIAHAMGLLKPGDTLCLRGGTYYETVVIPISGTADKPITIRSNPGELAVIDGGIREFYEDPARAWEPFAGGAEGEFQSTKAYPAGGGFGNFADSMIPFHRYLNFADLRSKNEFASEALSDRSDDPNGMYCGPGTRRDPATGRIHIRLAHTELAGLGDNQYRGETDPRKMPLVIAAADYALSIHKAHHLRVQDIVIRGATRAAASIADSDDVELDGVTLYGSGSALRTSQVQKFRMFNSALRGHAAPWGSRFHHKYRAHAGYLVQADGNDIEFANCEFTDNHDFIALYGAYDMRFHHNFVENFNDDGLEPGPKREHGQIFIYQNYISRVLSPFTAHGKKPKPVTGDPASGVYIYRNIVDLRRGTYKSPPEKSDPTGAYLDHPTEILDHDHGSPVHPNYYVYQNTFIMKEPYRGYYDFTWGGHVRGSTRRVFNNLFIQTDGLPRFNVIGLSPDDDFQSDGNLMWGLKEGPKYSGDFFAKFRQSALVVSSKKNYAPGWSANDRFADPKFVALDPGSMWPLDPRLQKDSPAIGAGVALPSEWPDPLRGADTTKPDIGAIPAGTDAPEFGVNGRIKFPFVSAPGTSH